MNLYTISSTNSLNNSLGLSISGLAPSKNLLDIIGSDYASQNDIIFKNGLFFDFESAGIVFKSQTQNILFYTGKVICNFKLDGVIVADLQIFGKIIIPTAFPSLMIIMPSWYTLATVSAPFNSFDIIIDSSIIESINTSGTLSNVLTHIGFNTGTLGDFYTSSADFNLPIQVVTPVCYHESNMIMTSNGYKQIINLIRGDEIITNNGSAKIKAIYKIPIFQEIEFIKIIKGEIDGNLPLNDVIVTLEHFFLINGCKVVAKYLPYKKVKIYVDFIYHIGIDETKDAFVNCSGLFTDVWGLDNEYIKLMKTCNIYYNKKSIKFHPLHKLLA